MATATLTSPASHTRTDRQTDKPAHADPGPALFLAAPISFVAVLTLLMWLTHASLMSF